VNNTKKPTLLSLRQHTQITTQELAQQAGVSLTEAYVVEIGGFADRAIAEKVLRAFSQLSGTPYTLDDVRLQNVSTPVAQRSQLSDLPTTKQATIPRRKG
jgi:predicted transcriptional regulator